MNQNFKDLFKSTFYSYLQIIKTVCPIKFEIYIQNLVLDSHSLWSWGQDLHMLLEKLWKIVSLTCKILAMTWIINPNYM